MVYQNRLKISFSEDLPAEFMELAIQFSTVEELKAILKTQIEKENFELCKKIQDEIDKKNGPKCND